MARTLIAFVGILSGIVLAGCSGGEKPVETVPVSGEVKRMSGEPVGNVTVVFYPKTGPVFTTKADAQGKFSTKAPPGENRVAVVSGSTASADMSAEAVQKAAEGDSKIDARFASPDSSGLSADVKVKQTEKLVFVVE
jgi:hypothetical protein